MGKFSPFGLLFPISLSSPILGFVGDFIDSEKTTVLKVKRAKWNDINKFEQRNKKDLGMTPGELGTAWLYAKGGEVYEDGFFRSIEKLSDLQPSLNGQVAGLFQGGVGYQVKKATGVVLNSSGINNVEYKGKEVIEKESSVAHRWSELRKIQGEKKLKRTLEMRRISFARHRDTRAVLEGCELRIRGEEEGTGGGQWVGKVTGSNGRWFFDGEFMDIYISFIGFKTSDEKMLGAKIKRGRLDGIILSREEVCDALKEVRDTITIKVKDLGSGLHINKLDLPENTGKTLALVGIHVNAYRSNGKIEKWEECKRQNKFNNKEKGCADIFRRIQKVLGIDEHKAGEGELNLTIGSSANCAESQAHWFTDRKHRCIVDGFKVHSTAKTTYSIEQELA